jgi:DNA-binding NarL/FixJ family response regulator
VATVRWPVVVLRWLSWQGWDDVPAIQENARTMDKESMNDRYRTRPILLIESQPIVAHAMELAFAMIDERVKLTVCHCAESATNSVRDTCRWFRIFVDLDVRGGHGLSLVHQCCERGAANRCVAVTSVHRPFWIREAKRMGMAGCIDKMASVDEFTAALRSVLDGRRCFPDPGSECDPLQRLTNRQRDVLSLLCVGYPTKVIASTLRLAEGTVDNHIGNVLRVLNAHNRAHAIYKAVALGYLPNVPQEPGVARVAVREPKRI